MAGAVAIAAAGAFIAGTWATEAGATATPDTPCYMGIWDTTELVQVERRHSGAIAPAEHCC